MTDGEVMERLWSYLRRMAKTTKEMRPSHRIDVLTCALLHYDDKSRKKLGMIIVVIHKMSCLNWYMLHVQCISLLVTLLPKRMKHAEEVLHKSSTNFDRLLATSKGMYYFAVIVRKL